MYSQHSHGVSRERVVTNGRLMHWAGWYDSFVNLMTLGKAGALRQTSIELARLVSGERVLEIGCGTGELALLAESLVGRSGRVVGIDAASEMIEVARLKASRKNVAVEFFIQPVEDMAFADGSFDVVFSSLMMHHLPDTLKEQALSEVRRVLRPGGRLVIIDIRRPTTAAGRLMNSLFLHGALKVGVQDLVSKLEQTGFIIEDSGSMPISMLGFIRAYTTPKEVEI